MRWLTGGTLAIMLCSCGPSDAERATAFAQRCAKAEFTQSQCLMLWEIAEQASSDSASANIASNIALGVAIGSSGGRR